MRNFYYIDSLDNSNDVIFYKIKTDLTKDQLISFIHKNAINYCEKFEMDIEEYLYHQDDEYVELEIDKITYLLSLKTCLKESTLDYKIQSKLKYDTINIKAESLI
jgi:hypothetical protein